MDPGLYVTFFNEGERFDDELPPVGPLEHVVVRDRLLIADRKDGHHADFFGNSRGIEAEYEFQRATGTEPGGVRRTDLRVVAPQGVYLRFVSFGHAAEHDPVPELGPYAIVVVGKQFVEADGDRLAIRIGNTQNLWELTATGGTALGGVIRPDIAFRTRSTRYHPEIKPFRPAHHAAAPAHPAKTHAAVAPAPSAHAPSHPAKSHPPAPGVPTKPHRSASPPPTAPSHERRAAPAPAAPRTPTTAEPAPRPAEVATPTLRDRIGPEQQTRSGSTVASPARERRQWGGAAWRLRFFIILSLVVLLAAFSIPSLSSLFAGSSAGPSTVGVGNAVTSPDWTYNVGSVRRVAKIGTAQAHGIYLVVAVAATNRTAAGAQLSRNNFSVASAGGDQYAAITGSVYSGTDNPTSSYAWPKEFPVGRSVIAQLIFDINPSATGLQLVIQDVPSTRVRLE